MSAPKPCKVCGELINGYTPGRRGNRNWKHPYHEDYTFTKGSVKVTLTYIGEGYHGDFDAADPDDAPLFRVDVERKPRGGESEEIDSACTQIRADDRDTDYQMLAYKAAVYADLYYKKYGYIAGCAARISWFDNDEQVDQMGMEVPF